LQPTPEKPDRPDYDHALKRVFAANPEGILSVFAPGATWLDDLRTELPGANRQADLVWKVEQPKGGPGIVHFELQSTNDDEMDERVVDYAWRIRQRFHLPVLSIVIYLRPDGEMPDPVYHWEWDEESRFRYAFDVIRLWEWQPEQVLATPYPNLWPLAGFMASVTVDKTAEIVDQIEAAQIPQEQREELTGDLALFAGMRLPWEAIYEAIRRRPVLKDLWEQSSLGKALEVIAEERGEARGEARGLEIGKAQGVALGTAQTSRDAIRIVLTSRFGVLADDLDDAIEHADVTVCGAVLARVGTDTLDQIRALLNLGPTASA